MIFNLIKLQLCLKSGDIIISSMKNLVTFSIKTGNFRYESMRASQSQQNKLFDHIQAPSIKLLLWCFLDLSPPSSSLEQSAFIYPQRKCFHQTGSQKWGNEWAFALPNLLLYCLYVSWKEPLKLRSLKCILWFELGIEMAR